MRVVGILGGWTVWGMGMVGAMGLMHDMGVWVLEVMISLLALCIKERGDHGSIFSSPKHAGSSGRS